MIALYKRAEVVIPSSLSVLLYYVQVDLYPRHIVTPFHLDCFTALNTGNLENFIAWHKTKKLRLFCKICIL